MYFIIETQLSKNYMLRFGKIEIGILLLCVQSCPSRQDPEDCSHVRFLRPWNSPGKDIGVGCHFLLQGIFPTQGLNPGLLHLRQILYH